MILSVKELYLFSVNLADLEFGYKISTEII